MLAITPKSVRLVLMVGAFVAVAVGTAVYVSSISIKPNKKVSIPFVPLSPTPKPPEDPIHHVLKTVEGDTTFVWLYGKVVSIDSDDAIGLHLVFTLDGDPFSTRLSVIVLPTESGYMVYQYTNDFRQDFSKTIMTSAQIKKIVLSPKTLTELRIPFKRIDPSEDITIAALESANKGIWQNLPVNTTLYAESIGYVSVP